MRKMSKAFRNRGIPWPSAFSSLPLPALPPYPDAQRTSWMHTEDLKASGAGSLHLSTVFGTSNGRFSANKDLKTTTDSSLCLVHQGKSIQDVFFLCGSCCSMSTQMRWPQLIEMCQSASASDGLRQLDSTTQGTPRSASLELQ